MSRVTLEAQLETMTGRSVVEIRWNGPILALFIISAATEIAHSSVCYIFVAGCFA